MYVSKYAPQIELKQFDEDVPEIQTLNQELIAIDKAKKAWGKIKKPVLVDDLGIYFEQYDNFPGALAKFVYTGIGVKGILKLVEKNNKAYRKLMLVYFDGTHSKTFEAVCPGKIVPPRKSKSPSSFPWNAIFIPDGSNKTSAEIYGTSEEEKYNHRTQALKNFLKWFLQK
ncbi:hypothetical protein KAW80_03595 [Candidatus Babeliales bacterium]|nr:hypothetical protein [Candidatus Babeliales bacterium]